MTTVNVYVPEDGPADHHKHLRALAAGIPNARLCPLDQGYQESDVAVLFGVGKRNVEASHARGALIFEHHLRRKKPVLIIERGFIKREDYYGVAWNGLNGMGDFCAVDCPADRWKALDVEIKPYRSGDYTLLCGQVPWDASVQHTDHMAWLKQVYDVISNTHDRPIIFRPHPLAKELDYGIPCSANSWEDDLKGANSVITFSSTASAMAILEGVPIFTLDPGSMAFEIGMHGLTPDLLDFPMKPHRDFWAYNLAYKQWTADEMASGMVWDRMKGFLE
jgi:hypothetical protein